MKNNSLSSSRYRTRLGSFPELNLHIGYLGSIDLWASGPLARTRPCVSLSRLTGRNARETWTVIWKGFIVVFCDCLDTGYGAFAYMYMYIQYGIDHLL